MTSAVIRYKYLQKPLEDSSLPTLLQYVNKWESEGRDRLAATIGLLIAQGLASAACLQSLTKDHLIKNGNVPHLPPLTIFFYTSMREISYHSKLFGFY